MTIFEQSGAPNNLIERIARLEAEVRALQRRNAMAERLDELAPDLGDVGEGSIARLNASVLMARYRIDESENVIVPDGYVYFAPISLEIDGDIMIDGKVYIL